LVLITGRPVVARRISPDPKAQAVSGLQQFRQIAKNFRLSEPASWQIHAAEVSQKARSFTRFANLYLSAMV